VIFCGDFLWRYFMAFFFNGDGDFWWRFSMIFFGDFFFGDSLW